MRKIVVGLLSVSLASVVGQSLSSAAAAVPPVDPPATASSARHQISDDLPNPQADKRNALRDAAISEVVSGKVTPERRGVSTVAKVGRTADTRGANSTSGGRNQYVELERATTDRIFVILAQFGNKRHPDFPDKDLDPETPGPNKFDGPQRNEIPEPDRAVDNSTVWQPDYSPEHYRQLYFGTGKNVESVKTYYEAQSSGRYSVDGTVTDWVKVPYNEARYGRSNDPLGDKDPGNDPAVCQDTNCENVWELVRDAANQWVADQKAKGRTDAQIAADMKSFDKWDRNDYDHDGDFNEPDGYIDHFQIVHSGGDQADGDPAQGEDAIWSHRWYAFGHDDRVTGPANNKRGGTQVGNTGLWIGDYTIQPENGGLSVFAHEYGHDLGLPDDYDTSGGGDNNNEHWTLMAQSRLNAEGESLGTRAGDIGQWNKLKLGWLNYETVTAGEQRTLELGPSEFNTAKPQAAVVVLPKKSVTTEYGDPFAGTKQYFSGNADDLDNSMTRDLDLTGRTSATLSLKGRYEIEEGFDFLFLEASTDDGATWSALDGTINGQPFPKAGGTTPTITGTSEGAWTDIAVPLNAYAGKKIKFRFHYRSDGGVSEGGFRGDEIKVVADGNTILTDGAETPTTWALNGFSVVGASSTGLYDHFYIAGNRTYVGFDKYLKTGPYFFGYLNTKPDFVDHYSYMQGLLISYWDTSQKDNNTNVHPGQGANMVIDSRPKPFLRVDGKPWRARVQVYDAPFSKSNGKSFPLHFNSELSPIKGQQAQPLFDDTQQYWFPELPNHGVKLPAVGVKIKVVDQKGTSVKIKIS